MKLFDVKLNTYVNSIKETNDKNSKFTIGDNVRISKYKNVFAKGNTPNRSEEVFVIKKVKNTMLWTYAINDFHGEKIFGTFYETNQKISRIEKVIRRKGDKLYVKWKGYDSSLNSWIDKKDLA